MAVSNAIEEARQKFSAKQEELAKVAKAAQDGERFDFSRKEVLELLGATDKDHALSKFKELNREADDIAEALAQAEAKEVVAAREDRERARNEPVRGGEMVHAVPDKGDELKTFGQLVTSSEEYKEAKENHMPARVEVDIEIKTLMSTTAGFPPESVRTGRLVEAATRPVQVLDLIPSFDIDSEVEKYMLETTRTHAAAETAEGAAYPEAAFVWTEQESPVRKIATSIPVTDEQLEDERQVERLLDQRLSFGVRQRLDLQVLVGDGIAPNLEGLLNVTGIQTQAKGTDSAIVAFMKALTLIRFTGRANPTGAIFHPNDWQDVLLTQTSDGDFLFGNPFQGPGPQQLFGIPVAQSDAITENTAVVADFMTYVHLAQRRGIVVQVGFVGSQFTEGKKTVRADMRAAFTVERPAAVCTITGI